MDSIGFSDSEGVKNLIEFRREKKGQWVKKKKGILKMKEKKNK
jgi:hypothetical protein